MKGKKTGGRTPYPVHDIPSPDMYSIAALYAKKGVQLMYGCTDFDIVAILTISTGYIVTAMSIMRLSGYKKGRIYQRLATSIKRGMIEQTRTRPNQYRLTIKGLGAYSLYQEKYKERMKAFEEIYRDYLFKQDFM